jgi:hypothetical protein
MRIDRPVPIQKDLDPPGLCQRSFQDPAGPPDREPALPLEMSDVDLLITRIWEEKEGRQLCLSPYPSVSGLRYLENWHPGRGLR